MCGFVAMQGAGARDERVVQLHDVVRLRIDDEGLRAALLAPAVERWSGVEIARMESFDGLHLWLATALPGFGLMAAEKTAVDSGLVGKFARWNAPTAVDGASFAYHAISRPNADDTLYEFGVHAHGPDAARLADQYVHLIQIWDRRHRGRHAHIDVHPTTATVPQLPDARVIDKHHTRVVLQWPEDDTRPQPH
jgi:protein-L-isoaspartate(D-aspartate) O-methyltransferase